ncbi:MAG: tRNA pseudouridine synthase B [Candidatus Magasanikbacteria bacterium GW2011_GWC2_34_16]|uniref:tRNA pseudouridine synthase B n=2 Tax=Candidatus Magasanikiibacteriota TaxID=1752731 RepID=A0A0G0JUZ1_9BACT|nr:MAG: tRNA pseudouridine synthase B [Candidatus Magasanikbacteria bacterium GW2011_GWC2_34_16]KKQ40729.1 MAG: tRNA pseudouridine synthase B [Candidatus Magasanikbacteria bacterium GW2011_GWA2_37_8]
MILDQNNEPKFLLINKPVDWTSFDVVAYIRRQYPKGTKVGHAGTLDPFATGLLIVGVGREATKRIDEFKNLPKTYNTIIHLGKVSDTDDSTGIIKNYEKNELNKMPELEEIKEVLNKFIGKQLQTPPMFSAKKINGQRLYTLARQGVEIERQPNEIEIYNIKLINYNWPHLKIEIKCSVGTYIRTIAHDIGLTLDCGAYCEELTRTAIGEYLLKDAKTIGGLTSR